MIKNLKRWLFDFHSLFLIGIIALSGVIIYLQREKQFSNTLSDTSLKAKTISQVVYPYLSLKNAEDFTKSLGNLADMLRPDYLLIVDKEGLIKFSYPNVELYKSNLPDDWHPKENRNQFERKLSDGEIILETVAPIKSEHSAWNDSLGYVILGYSKNKLTESINTFSLYLLFIAIIGAASILIATSLVYKTFQRAFYFFKLQISQRAGGDATAIETQKKDPKVWKDVIDDFNKIMGRLKDAESKFIEQASLAAIGQSTAMVAHDVRKPLTSMKALLTVLPEIKDDPEQVKKMIANVDRSIVQTNTMLNEILDFSRDSTALELKINDPQGMITSALSDALRNHPGAIVGILYDLKHRYCMHVDGPRTIRVLTNILDNALDAMKRDSGKLFGQIRIGSYEVERDGKRFMGITIADDGPGIPEDILPKIFDPFFTNGKKGGTGLGLAICHKVVSMHGGKIEAGKDGKGCGTKFTIELPSSDERALINDDDLIHSSKELEVFRVEEERRVEYGDTANKAEFMRIHKERGRESYLLIVDDEPLFRETVRGLLNTLSQVKDHIKVIEADSGEMGLKIFEGRKFDYVIADIDLGHACMNGYKFAQIVMEKYPNSYVLIHSNKRKEEMDAKIRSIACHPSPVCHSRESGNPVNNLDTVHPEPVEGRTEKSKFLGFLPKPMKASELLQFLACKTFEAPNPPFPPLEKGGEGGFALDSRLSAEGGSASGGHGADRKESKKVLIINDDSDLLISFKFMLRDSNVKILEALNYEAALEHLKNSKIDVVLSDINLGDMDRNGYDLLKHVRAKNGSLPFYMVSGYSRADEEPKAKELGASGYLQLPIDKNQLKEILQ